MKDKTLLIQDDIAYFNENHQMLYHSCTRIDVYTRKYPNYGVDKVHCGGNALFLVQWNSEMVGRDVIHHVCEKHLNQIMSQAKDKNWKIIDERNNN